MDFITLALIVAALALILGLCTRGGLRAYARGEWRLARQKTWAPGDEPGPFTVGDPRVAKMDLRQRSLGKRLRRQGRTLHAGKEYIPVLTKPVPREKSARSDKVVPIRKSN